MKLNLNKLGNNLKDIRESKHYTIYTLSLETGIKEAVLRSYENGIRTPSIKKLITLTNTLNVSLDSLFNTTYE